MSPLFAETDIEANVIAVICVIFLLLFIVAGVKDILERRKEKE